MGYNAKNYNEQGGERAVIGGELDVITGGTLKFEGADFAPSAFQADSAATDIAGLVTDFNALLAKLRAAGIMRNE